MRFTSFGANRTEGITAHALPPLKQFLERFQDARVNASRKNLEPFQTAQFQMEPFHFLSCKQGLTRSDFVEFDYVESSFASDLSNRMPLLHDQILSKKIRVKCLNSVYEME